MEASREGHLDMVALLLEHGRENFFQLKKNYFSKTTLFEKIFCVLFSNRVHSFHLTGADIHAQTEETQETALSLACCGGFQDVAAFLLQAGIKNYYV